MPRRGRRSARIRQCQRARLRLAVLRLGGCLGWGPRDVIAFAEALTNRPWRQCGRYDLEAVRDEYVALLWAIRRRAARKGHFRPLSSDIATRVYDRAVPR